MSSLFNKAIVLFHAMASFRKENQKQSCRIFSNIMGSYSLRWGIGKQQILSFTSHYQSNNTVFQVAMVQENLEYPFTVHYIYHFKNS